MANFRDVVVLSAKLDYTTFNLYHSTKPRVQHHSGPLVNINTR